MPADKEQSPMEKTYRFWIYHNNTNVRLSLTVGPEIRIARGGETDEGWHWEEGVYCVDRERGILICEHACDGVDCDGRLSGGFECYARLDELEARPKPWIYVQPPTRLQQQELDSRPVRYPEWDRLDSWRRDHQAEAAGF